MKYFGHAGRVGRARTGRGVTSTTRCAPPTPPEPLRHADRVDHAGTRPPGQLYGGMADRPGTARDWQYQRPHRTSVPSRMNDYICTAPTIRMLSAAGYEH